MFDYGVQGNVRRTSSSRSKDRVVRRSIWGLLYPVVKETWLNVCELMEFLVDARSACIRPSKTSEFKV